MLGLFNSDQRAAFAWDRKGIRNPLQSGQTAFGARPRNPGTNSGKVPVGQHRQKLPVGYQVSTIPVLGGLHHEYVLKRRLRRDGRSFCAQNSPTVQLLLHVNLPTLHIPALEL